MTGPFDPYPAQPITCVIGHTLHRRNTALDMTGTVICLDCVALLNDANSRTAGRLLAVMLNLAPFPSREEVGA